MTPLLLIAVIAGIIIFFVILKSRSTGTVELPAQKIRNPRPAPFTGECAGVAYTVDNLSEEFITVEIEAPLVSKPLEFNIRRNDPGKSTSALEGDNRKAEIEALISLGAVYFDIGYNTSRVAVEFPAGSVNIDKGFAEKAVSHLIRLRDKSA